LKVDRIIDRLRLLWNPSCSTLCWTCFCALP